jgi:putative transposase
MAWTRIVFRLLRCCWQRIWHYLFNKNSYGRRKQITQEKLNSFPRHPPKPEWVKKEIIRLKALMPNEGHRKIAFAFDRLHSQKRKMTVGRTFVSYTIRDHQYEIHVLRRKIKHKQPSPVPKNLIWAMDLTGKTDLDSKTHNILGVIEHQSRACLTLSAITDKSTMSLLRTLFNLIEHYQKPKIIRTDNEAMFTSRLFGTVLWLIGKNINALK